MTDASGGKDRMTRMDRAQVVRDVVMASSDEHGGWDIFDLGEGRKARIWRIDAGAGWVAEMTTRFSGVTLHPVRVAGYEEALLLQESPPRTDDVVLDVRVEPFEKVLSLGITGGEVTLITMRPGPWEALFGLAHRDWTPSAAPRLSRRS